MLNFSDIKIGKVVIFNNKPCVVIKADLRSQPRLAAVKNAILKDLVTGQNYPKTFNASESIEEGNLVKQKASFLYKNGDELSFMLSETYETIDVSSELLSEQLGYLSEGLEVTIHYFNDAPISIELPIKISLTVTMTEEVTKGNTVGNLMKDATLETGMVIKVPQFINIGDRIVIKTEDNEYCEKDKSK
jgi:elongation factor P